MILSGGRLNSLANCHSESLNSLLTSRQLPGSGLVPKATTRLLPFLFIGGMLAAQDATPSSASGKEMYLAYCAVCHGVDGKGDGPVASLLRIRPHGPDQARQETQWEVPRRSG